MAAGIDGEQVKDRLSGKVPEKFGGAVLAGFGLMFLLRVFLVSVGTISSGEPLTVGEYAANFSDFFTSPAMLIVGVMLWQRKSFGYALPGQHAFHCPDCVSAAPTSLDNCTFRTWGCDCRVRNGVDMLCSIRVVS